MATGYTQIIKDSNETDYEKLFQKFALQCARAFGALVSMRDDNYDAKIPDEIIPSDYYKKEITKHKKELAIARKRSMKEWDKLAETNFSDEREYLNQNINESVSLRAKYENILDKILAYNSPTPEHVEYKNFMIQQVRGSIDFDCDYTYYSDKLKNLKRLSAKEFKQQTIKELENSLKYLQEEHKKGIESAKKRTVWIKALKKSLNIKPNGIKIKS